MNDFILGEVADNLFGPAVGRHIRRVLLGTLPTPAPDPTKSITTKGEPMNSEEECPHEWTDEIETCRNCEGIDVQSIALNSSDATPGVLRAPSEPLHGSYCTNCQSLTMVSPARHCTLCGKVDWVFDMDEEIFGE